MIRTMLGGENTRRVGTRERSAFEKSAQVEDQRFLFNLVKLFRRPFPARRELDWVHELKGARSNERRVADQCWGVHPEISGGQLP
jgi:hypothetical protein